MVERNVGKPVMAVLNDMFEYSSLLLLYRDEGLESEERDGRWDKKSWK